MKYNPEDVIAVTKTVDGKLVWLEKGNEQSGLKHIVNSHVINFSDRGITDISAFLNRVGAGGGFGRAAHPGVEGVRLKAAWH